MALKAPGILAFLLSLVVALAVLAAKFLPGVMPFLGGDGAQFYALLAAYAMLVLGCTMRGL
jgi:hypothetical protein